VVTVPTFKEPEDTTTAPVLQVNAAIVPSEAFAAARVASVAKSEVLRLVPALAVTLPAIAPVLQVNAAMVPKLALAAAKVASVASNEVFKFVPAFAVTDPAMAPVLQVKAAIVANEAFAAASVASEAAPEGSAELTMSTCISVPATAPARVERLVLPVPCNADVAAPEGSADETMSA
jgi:hypothetical protein